MPITKISISDFILRMGTHPVLDVRSPGEYKHAHIPQAYSLPLFTDDERRIVGTAYRHEGKEKAIRIGLDFFGVKMNRLIDEALVFTNSFYSQHEIETSNKTVMLHCWRGGMRSAGVAWLLDLYGFNVFTVIGGYKAYRNWVLNQLEDSCEFRIVGGYTGSGKTELLKKLQDTGEPVIDLEELAAHRGSAFGALGMPPQPSQEMFENLLANKLRFVSSEHTTPIWLEDESRRIGQVNIPAFLFEKIRNSPLYFLEIPFDERLKHLVNSYGKYETGALAEAILRIQKRLGGLETKQALQFLETGDIPSCFSLLLRYYDKCYLKAVGNRDHIKEQVFKIRATGVAAKENAALLLHQAKSKHDRPVTI